MSSMRTASSIRALRGSNHHSILITYSINHSVNIWCIITPDIYCWRCKVPRQSITLTEKNDSWLRNHVDHIQEYSNKSELINDLIRRARRAEAVNIKLEEAEASGFVDQTAAEMLAEFKSELK